MMVPFSDFSTHFIPDTDSEMDAVTDQSGVDISESAYGPAGNCLQSIVYLWMDTI